MTTASKKIVSGTKYLTSLGTTAIKDGIKATGGGIRPDALSEGNRPLASKPAWLRIKLSTGKKYTRVRSIVREHKLATVCEESHCPNLSECWNNGTATIMLMGAVCTRACRFCAVDTGNPNGWLDPEEPQNAARSVALMGLKYIVLTSVDRDDLPDGGASHFARTITAIRHACPDTAVEALTPDFNGDTDAVTQVVRSGIKVFAQNLETVRRLTTLVRDPRAGYEKTLGVLEFAKTVAPVLTKTSLLLGLGETDGEIEQAMQDLRAVDCDILTLGQYLRPGVHHLPLQRWITPEQFDDYRQHGLALGFREVASGPLVRSSYRAERVLDGNNLGFSADNRIPARQL